MTRVTCVVLVSKPLMPEIVRIYEPLITAVVAVICKTEEVVAGLIENDGVAPKGKPLTPRFTCPVNPPDGLIKIG